MLPSSQKTLLQMQLLYINARSFRRSVRYSSCYDITGHIFIPASSSITIQLSLLHIYSPKRIAINVFFQLNPHPPCFFRHHFDVHPITNQHVTLPTQHSINVGKAGEILVVSAYRLTVLCTPCSWYSRTCYEQPLVCAA